MREQSASHESQGPIEIPEHFAQFGREDATGPLIEDLRLLLGVIAEWKNSGVELLNALGGAIEGEPIDDRGAIEGFYAALRAHFRELEEILYWCEQTEGYDDTVVPVGPESEEHTEIVIPLRDE